MNEFLYEGKTVLLIHGLAGSGKSTTAKKLKNLFGNYMIVIKKLGIMY